MKYLWCNTHYSWVSWHSFHFHSLCLSPSTAHSLYRYQALHIYVNWVMWCGCRVYAVRRRTSWDRYDGKYFRKILSFHRWRVDYCGMPAIRFFLFPFILLLFYFAEAHENMKWREEKILTIYQLACDWWLVWAHTRLAKLEDGWSYESKNDCKWYTDTPREPRNRLLSPCAIGCILSRFTVDTHKSHIRLGYHLRPGSQRLRPANKLHHIYMNIEHEI